MHPKVMIRAYVGRESDSSTHVDQSRRHVQFRALRPYHCWKHLKLRSNYLFSRRYMRQKWLWRKCSRMFAHVFDSVSRSTSSGWILNPKLMVRLYVFEESLWSNCSWTSSQQLLEAFKKQCFDFKDIISGKSGYWRIPIYFLHVSFDYSSLRINLYPKNSWTFFNNLSCLSAINCHTLTMEGHCNPHTGHQYTDSKTSGIIFANICQQCKVDLP